MASKREQGSVSYALERLYVDQAAEIVKDVIAPTIAWLAENPSAGGRTTFELGHAATRAPPKRRAFMITWNPDALVSFDPDVLKSADRIRRGRSALAEKRTELAAYGLALAAISVLLPGRKVVSWSKWVAPDILLDATPGKLRGVEAAGRFGGGWRTLRALATSKGGRIRQLHDVVEAHLSLWCGRPRVAMMIRAKP